MESNGLVQGFEEIPEDIKQLYRTVGMGSIAKKYN